MARADDCSDPIPARIMVDSLWLIDFSSASLFADFSDDKLEFEDPVTTCVSPCVAVCCIPRMQRGGILRATGILFCWKKMLDIVVSEFSGFSCWMVDAIGSPHDRFRVSNSDPCTQPASIL